MYTYPLNTPHSFHTKCIYTIIIVLGVGDWLIHIYAFMFLPQYSFVIDVGCAVIRYNTPFSLVGRSHWK